MSYLLDTNVLSELRKQRCDPAVREWLSQQREAELFISVVTLGELKFGIENKRLKDPAQAEGLDRWFRRLRRNYSGKILPLNEEIAELWGELCPDQPLSFKDGLIAATALYHGLTVVTRNVRDFRRSGVDLLNPFSGD
jgi:toxin FitB